MSSHAPRPPRVLDEATALRTAAFVAPVRRTDARAAQRLRDDVNADLRAAEGAARRWTGLGADLPPATVRVVSREGWVRANLGGLRGALDPLGDKLAERSPAAVRSVAGRVVGAQLGALLGLLSTKVLGQYVLPLGGPGQAQLVLVGPNLVELGERHGGLADDVRRTVLLHEIAHRLQFDSVPWLGDHLRSLLSRYLHAARLEPGALVDALSRLPDALREAREGGTLTPVLHAVLSEEQRDVIDEAQALMTLLEGHGNATMLEAADGLVDDPERVRAALERRRDDLTTRVLTAVAGLDLKRRQYREGEKFVRAVVARVGTAGLNRAFDAPTALPTLEEISAPDAWIARVEAAGGGDKEPR